MRITKEQYEKIKEVYLAVIQEVQESLGFKFPPNVRDTGTLDLIIYGSVKYDNFLDVGAHFLYEIATKHPFYDGNKRTAFITGTVLALVAWTEAGVPFEQQARFYEKQIEPIFNKMGDKEVVDFMLALADKKRSFRDVRDFLILTVAKLL